MTHVEMTLQQAAEVLGVHYMTAYRYVRLGMLPARKEGARWQVDPADVEALRSGTAVAGPVGRLGVPAPDAGRRRAPWAERLEARLVAGDLEGTWGVVTAAVGAGMGVDELYVDVIGRAMEAIGERWAEGVLDPAIEHRATGIVTQLVSRVGPRFRRPGPSRGVVVLCTAVEERHGLPLLLLAELLRAEGFEVFDLGCDLPPASVGLIVATTDRLVAVGVGVTMSPPDAVVGTVGAVRAAIGARQVPILLGGAGVAGERHALAMGADGYTRDARAFVAAAVRASAG